MALVEALDVIAVEALVPNLHPSTKGTDRRKVLNREADCLSGRRKTPTNKPRTCPNLVLRNKQFGR